MEYTYFIYWSWVYHKGDILIHVRLGEGLCGVIMMIYVILHLLSDKGIGLSIGFNLYVRLSMASLNDYKCPNHLVTMEL